MFAATAESNTPIIVDGIKVVRPLEDREACPVPALELAVLIMALNEGGNIGEVVRSVRAVLDFQNLQYEVVVMDGGSTDNTVAEAIAAGARIINQSSKGYAQGLEEAIGTVQAQWLITLDGDCSHEAALIPLLLAERGEADIVVGSRWIKGGGFEGPAVRHILSRLLNSVFRWILAVPVHDLSSGYRLYRRAVLHGRVYQSRDFSILQEMLIGPFADGFVIREIPLQFRPRSRGSSHVRLFNFAMSYLATLWRMWRLRNDAGAADYDRKAFDSWILPQRWWQRKRYSNIMGLLGEYRLSGRVLDVGCGSSRIISSLPHAVAFDYSLAKLRALRTTNAERVCGSALNLPFADGHFDCLIHSQLIEHLPMDDRLFSEMRRVLRPGGTLIVGTVDYASWLWPTIERVYGFLMPHAYADEHISHYTLASLKEKLVLAGFEPLEVRTIVKGEITVKAVAR